MMQSQAAQVLASRTESRLGIIAPAKNDLIINNLYKGGRRRAVIGVGAMLTRPKIVERYTHVLKKVHGGDLLCFCGGRHDCFPSLCQLLSPSFFKKVNSLLPPLTHPLP
jgi:hypothetical protein